MREHADDKACARCYAPCKQTCKCGTPYCYDCYMAKLEHACELRASVCKGMPLRHVYALPLATRSITDNRLFLGAIAWIHGRFGTNGRNDNIVWVSAFRYNSIKLCYYGTIRYRKNTFTRLVSDCKNITVMLLNNADKSFADDKKQMLRIELPPDQCNEAYFAGVPDLPTFGITYDIPVGFVCDDGHHIQFCPSSVVGIHAAEFVDAQ